MNVVDVHNRINNLAEEHGLSMYELAKRSGMALSSLYNMFERGTMPKLETLEKICDGMDISVSEFFVVFSKPKVGGYVTEDDLELVETNHGLSKPNQNHLLVYAKGMLEAQNNAKK